MNVLIVYAHHEPASFTSAMKNLAIEVLSHQGHNVVVSDLYGQGFNPLAQKWDFVTTSGGHFNYMLEQKHAARLDLAFAPDIVGEIEKLQASELILFVTPIWWLSVPAILKGWFDRVMAMGVTWDEGKIYENGLLRGKQAMIIAISGRPVEFYQQSGRFKSTPDQILQPINNGVLAFCGLNVHEPFVTPDVLTSNETGREKILQDLQFRLENMINSPQWLTYYN